MNDLVQWFEKILSANDVGKTGSHQAGIHLKKSVAESLCTFQHSEKNPRSIIRCTDPDENFWDFTIIHYNNKYFGGTRNEFRMTHLSSFFRKWDCSEGDTLRIGKDSSGIFHVEIIKNQRNDSTLPGPIDMEDIPSRVRINVRE